MFSLWPSETKRYVSLHGPSIISKEATLCITYVKSVEKYTSGNQLEASGPNPAHWNVNYGPQLYQREIIKVLKWLKKTPITA